MDEAHHGSEYRRLIRELFDKRDLERDTRELLLYTMRKHGNRASRFRQPADYPAEAFLRILDGRRRYDFDGPKTFIQHCQSVIDSLVSHDLDKAKRDVPIVDPADAEDGTPLGGYDSSRIIANDHTEQDVIARVDAERHNAKLRPDERRYEELRSLGLCRTATDFSRHMAIPVNVVRNIERRLARRKRKRNDNNQAI
jgi:hypothetical protein